VGRRNPEVGGSQGAEHRARRRTCDPGGVPDQPTMGPRQRRIALLDAAVSLLGRDGPRGLTHRAVDSLAGVAEGSTSYYFRTRAELVEAALGHLAEREDERGDGTDPETETADPVEALSAFVTRLATVERETSVARYELILEVARQPDLQPLLDRWRSATTGRLRAAVVGADSADPDGDTRTLAALLDGLVLHQIAHPQPASDEATTRRTIQAFLAGLAADRTPRPAG
jgi:DNA-binding transcriptional regulator YbjK